MNTNFAHNLINGLSLLIASVATFDWSSLVSDALAVKIIGSLMLLKLVMNGLRDGLSGMVAPQPPVEKPE